MAVQDEANRKIAGITFDASKMTAKNFLKMFKFLLVNGFRLYKSRTKQSLKSLTKTQNSISKMDLENLELSNKDFKMFKKIAKNCGLKYALVYDKHTNKYTFFFNSGKAEVYEQAYNQLRKEIEKRQKNKKTSLKEKIKEKQKIASKFKNERKQKQTYSKGR